MASANAFGGEAVKRKRGRPRKHAVDETILPASSSDSNQPMQPDDAFSAAFSRLGNFRSSSFNLPGEHLMTNVTPHSILVAPTEDVAEKILSFAQERGRVLCILSANGPLSAVTLRRLTGSLTRHQGHYNLISLQGSYIVDEAGYRTGGISILVSSRDGLLGGAVGGRLIAAGEVKVTGFSFAQDKSEASDKGEEFFSACGEVTQASNNCP